MKKSFRDGGVPQFCFSFSPLPQYGGNDTIFLFQNVNNL